MGRKTGFVGVETTVMLILVLVSAVGFAAFLTSSSGGMQSLFKGACEKNPSLPFCGGEEDHEAADFELAMKSTEALVCAVNSVGSGTEWAGSESIDCSEYYNTSGKPESEEDYTFMVKEIKKSSDCNKACKDDQAGLCEGLTDCTVEGGTLIQKEWLTFDNLARDKCECTLKTSSRPYFDCTTAGSTVQECTVSNFRLPQEIDKAEDYLPYYGDPKFLVYWQSFPMSEDTWTFHDAWWMYAATITAAALPLGGAGNVLGKAGMKGAAAVAKTAYSNIKSSVVKYETKQITRAALKAESNAISRIAKQDLKSVVVQDVKDKALALVGRPGSIFRQGGKVVLAGGTIVALHVDAIVDSWYSKLVARNNTMVLKNAGVVEPQTYLVENHLPVILKYRDGLFSKATPTFVLASPCYISSMKVSRMVSDKDGDSLVCENFGYDGLTGDISCTEPKITSTGFPRKGLGYPSCYEPDEYIRTRFQAKNWEGEEDPVNGYVLGLRNDMPEYVEMSSNVQTAIISDKAIIQFNPGQIPGFAKTTVLFDTDEGLKSLGFESSAESAEDGKTVYSGTARYCGIRADAHFDKPSGGCGITEDGFARAQQVSTTLWNYGTMKPFAGSGYGLEELDGLGCYAYIEMSGDLGKEKKVDDPAVLDGLKASGGLYGQKPTMEYEESCDLGAVGGLIGTCGSTNVFYRYTGSSWEWRIDKDSASFSAVRALTVEECSDNNIEPVHRDVMAGLIGKDYAGGVDVFKEVLSKDTDSSGQKTSDDYLNIIYDTENDPMCSLLGDMRQRIKVNLRYGPGWSISSVPSSLPGAQSDYWMELFDNNGDTFVDMVGISSGYGSAREQYIAFTENEEGGMNSYTMTRCSLPESIIVSDADKTGDKNNYCFASPTKAEIAWKITGNAVLAVGTVAAGFLTDGAAIGLLMVSGATSGTMEVIGDHKSTWPKSG